MAARFSRCAMQSPPEGWATPSRFLAGNRARPGWQGRARSFAMHLSFRKHPAFQIFLSRKNGLVWITYVR